MGSPNITCIHVWVVPLLEQIIPCGEPLCVLTMTRIKPVSQGADLRQALFLLAHTNHFSWCSACEGWTTQQKLKGNSAVQHISNFSLLNPNLWNQAANVVELRQVSNNVGNFSHVIMFILQGYIHLVPKLSAIWITCARDLEIMKSYQSSIVLICYLIVIILILGFLSKLVRPKKMVWFLLHDQKNRVGR